ncbi:MAG: hypothetical protein IIA58_02505 [Candidatus Marinimicrobia bacterium]|nr:hypothetical protein [Candidatus Neomarinimicrobiota bacterium]
MTTDKTEPNLISFFENPGTLKKNLSNIEKSLSILIDQKLLVQLIKDNPAPDQAINFLERYINLNKKRTDLSNLFYEPGLESLLTLSGHSEYYAGVLLRRPDLFEYLNPDNNSAQNLDIGDSALEDIGSSTIPLDDRLHQLRLYKEKAFFQIGARNILGYADLETTMTDLSNLADFIIHKSLDIAISTLNHKSNIQKSTFCVISVGKLGGKELNYSSDIDLLFVYNNGKSSSDNVNKSIQFSYYSEIASKLSSILSDKTDDLQMYRVDLRLRPDGEAGPIVRDLAGYLRYYERSGHTWERQMLIKARISAGDINTGSEFIRRVKPWIYSPDSGISYIRNIYRVKLRSERKYRSRNNIKLSPGGIRDIESVCQTLQHLFGSSVPELQGIGTLESLNQLKLNGKLSSGESDTLQEAYRFFRKVEHALQYAHNRQVHTLPVKNSSVLHLAKRLSHSSASELMNKITEYRKSVRQIFENLFISEVNEIDVDLIFDSNSDNKEALTVMKQLGFKNTQNSLKNVQFLCNGHPPHLLSESIKNKFIDLWNVFYHNLSRSPDMDLTLNNLEKIVHSYNAPGTLYELFLQQPDLLKLLIFLAGSSSNASDLLSANPELIDGVFQPDLPLDASKLKNMFKYEIEKNLNVVEFKKAELFFFLKWQITIYLWYFLGDSHINTVETALTDLADVILKESVEKLYYTNEINVPLTLFTLGKHGSKEIGFSSDLDLIFVLSPPNRQKISAKDIELGTRFIQLFNQLVAGHDESFPIYKLDYRVRPEGKNAVLLTTLPELTDYLKSRALFWEVMAFSKIRQIWNSGNSITDAEEIIKSSVNARKLTRKDYREFMRITLRTRKEKTSPDDFNLKWSEGGIADIENSVLLSAIHYSSASALNTPPKGTINTIKFLNEQNVISQSQSALLEEAYKFYRIVEQHLFMSLNIKDSKFPIDQEKRHYISKVIGLDNWYELNDLLEGYSSSVKSVVEALLLNVEKSLKRAES